MRRLALVIAVVGLLTGGVLYATRGDAKDPPAPITTTIGPGSVA
jgi:hypothetical protein